MNDNAFDCAVIGGGHNGLIAAAYLAKAGKRVCVLERRQVLGGCATTEEPWPGYKVSTGAYVISLLLPSIIRDLKLKHYGLHIVPDEELHRSLNNHDRLVGWVGVQPLIRPRINHHFLYREGGGAILAAHQ